MSNELLYTPSGPEGTEFTISAHDQPILHELAVRVAELASRPVEQEKRDLWYSHNALEETRPVIFCGPENGWTEIIREKDLQCEGKLAREWSCGCVPRSCGARRSATTA